MVLEPSVDKDPRELSPVVRLAGLSGRRGRIQALKSINLTLSKGEVFGLIGPNGAGKTTAIQILLGLRSASAGRAEILGRDCSRLRPETLARIGYVSQDQQWPLGATLRSLTRLVAPLYPTWDEQFCQRLMERFLLDPRRPLGRLSKGQQARARLVLALAYRPELLILDEPFSGLDPIVRQDVVDGLLELTSQESWTVLLADHEMSLIERLADRVGFLVAGQMAVVESLEDLQARCRMVHLELSEPLATTFDPFDHWHLVKTEDRRISFLDSRFPTTEDEAAKAYQERLPDLNRMDVSLPSLEQIFVAFCSQYDSARI